MSSCTGMDTPDTLSFDGGKKKNKQPENKREKKTLQAMRYME